MKMWAQKSSRYEVVQKLWKGALNKKTLGKELKWENL